MITKFGWCRRIELYVLSCIIASTSVLIANPTIALEPHYYLPPHHRTTSCTSSDVFARPFVCQHAPGPVKRESIDKTKLQVTPQQLEHNIVSYMCLNTHLILPRCYIAKTLTPSSSPLTIASASSKLTSTPQPLPILPQHKRCRHTQRQRNEPQHTVSPAKVQLIIHSWSEQREPEAS
jgi:hypothetical protein